MDFMAGNVTFSDADLGALRLLMSDSQVATFCAIAACLGYDARALFQVLWRNHGTAQIDRWFNAIHDTDGGKDVYDRLHEEYALRLEGIDG